MHLWAPRPFLYLVCCDYCCNIHGCAGISRVSPGVGPLGQTTILFLVLWAMSMLVPVLIYILISGEGGCHLFWAVITFIWRLAVASSLFWSGCLDTGLQKGKDIENLFPSWLPGEDFCFDNVHNQKSRPRYSVFINDEFLSADLMNTGKPPPLLLSFSFASFTLFTVEIINRN